MVFYIVLCGVIVALTFSYANATGFLDAPGGIGATVGWAAVMMTFVVLSITWFASMPSVPLFVMASVAASLCLGPPIPRQASENPPSEPSLPFFSSGGWTGDGGSV